MHVQALVKVTLIVLAEHVNLEPNLPRAWFRDEEFIAKVISLNARVTRAR